MTAISPVAAVPAPKSPVEKLYPREREILGLIARGKRRKDIADELGLSEQTMVTYCKRIYKALNVHSNVEATRVAYAAGLV